MPSAKKSSNPAPLSIKTHNLGVSSQSSTARITHANTGEKTGKAHKRSRSGCFTCRLRRKKCDENHPACGACVNLNVRCEYKRPVWWGIPDQRRLQKERIKTKIKNQKVLERNNSQSDSFRNRNNSLVSPTSISPDFNRPIFAEPQDMFASHLPTPGLGTAPYGPFPPYEVDVKTERQTFINDVPMRHDSSTSTFSAFAPPQLSAPMPTFTGDEWLGEEYFEQASSYQGLAPGMIDPGVDQTSIWLQSSIPVSDHDRPLLDHFIHNVLRQIFPVLEAHQRGHLRAQAILRALETNKCYLHCCLSVAAIHLKTTEGLVGDQVDTDIMRHRYEAISQLCQALGEDVNLEEILDATLAMIFFHCSVGPSDDYLPDIPWFNHFEAAANLVNRLDLPLKSMECSNGYMAPSFSMTLTSWIDILGSTMTGKTPQFAHTYRSKHLGGTSSGLRELMGCDDRIMYLISEIACLDSLKTDGRVDDLAVCSHVQALGRQLEYTESADPTLENPYSPSTGSIRPEALTKTMSHIFRIAARIYLCSLVPGFDRNQPTNENMIQAITDALQYIPAGPYGFDRSLVWPILMAGVYSTPASQFRSVLADRSAALGDHGDLGSFGRMYRLLQEVWRLSDDPTNTQGVADDSYNSSLTSPISKLDRTESPTGTGATLGGREIKRQQVQWRDVMRRNNWHYLLI
ncbi:C6 finger domain transcription factor nosA [Penicillium cosmopolitanum]|uniref:C6 finger domain transcription factor nosA n=1 Tax=Penicillium cosmopolitanum TaxID=1131564 RepID=A0A9W9SDH5_9EURO|nr:C6 finger domain transcription factor nosA [Penicillium cosmopolitanum]KAJ5376608.1 C6 finger domain transcription factor nosA [Penicillium cosmopolitanum]